MTPLGQLLLEPCGTCGGRVGVNCGCLPEPGDDEAGRALLAAWGGQIAARCVDVRRLLKGTGAA